VARVLLDALGLVLDEVEVVVRQLHVRHLPRRLGAHELPRREPGCRLPNRGRTRQWCFSRGRLQRLGVATVGQYVAFRRCDHAGSGGRRLGASRVRHCPGHARHRRHEARGEGIRARGQDGRSGNRCDNGSPRRDDHFACTPPSSCQHPP
jgi:hypothetical protein